MTKQEHLLTILAEECVETAQRVSKALRFGLEEIQEGQPLTNAERIVYEFNDICALMFILRDEGCFNHVSRLDMMDAKKAKVKKWLEYSKKEGTLL